MQAGDVEKEKGGGKKRGKWTRGKSAVSLLEILDLSLSRQDCNTNKVGK